MQQMQGLDAAFVAFERSNAPLHIASTIIYDPSTAPGGFVRFKDILRFIESRLHLAPSMRQRMVRVPFGIDYPYWIEDPDFDIEYHVRHAALPKPGDWRQLQILAARNFSRPLDLTRPPWEIMVVEGLDKIPGAPKGSYAMLTKVHHSAIDGVSGVDLMHALHTLSPEVEEPKRKPRWRPDRVPHQFRLFAKGYARSFTMPFRQARALAQTAPGLAKVAVGTVKGDYSVKDLMSTPRTRFNDPVSPHRVVDGKTFKLSEIKAMRKLAEGATVNDVMLSIVGGAMRKYLQSKEELPEETLAAFAPISVRDDKERNTMGNQVAAMRAPLGSHIEDVVERMNFVQGETKKSKSVTHAVGARKMTEISKNNPALYLGLGARLFTQFGIANRMKPFFNTIVTNVPGPPVPIYSAGAKLVSIYGMVCLIDGMGLGHVVHSYCDDITITATADREAMPDPEFYAQCLEESFDEHLAALKDVAGEAA